MTKMYSPVASSLRYIQHDYLFTYGPRVSAVCLVDYMSWYMYVVLWYVVLHFFVS